MDFVKDNEIFGLLKTKVDVHTLGITTCASILRECGYKVYLFNNVVSEAIQNLQDRQNQDILKSWILDNNIVNFGFSYRLDPKDGFNYFSSIFNYIKNTNELNKQVKRIHFAGLPPTCEMVKAKYPNVTVFPGDEPPALTLKMLGVPENRISENLIPNSDYDDVLMTFASNLIKDGRYKELVKQDHFGYRECGTEDDTYLRRLEYCKNKKSLPIIRAHAGPYNPDREKALSEFELWIKKLNEKQLLDVLSLGTSQLSQSNFEEDWTGKANGGGIPINNRYEYEHIRKIAHPMLVRTYAGTKNMSELAKVYTDYLHISWHALSIWWFCENDGRGPYTVEENIKEQFKTIEYIATTETPLEPIVPHHFSFRGGDDVSYILAGYLAVQLAKRKGIKHLVLQTMLNNPKHTWGIQDVAKTRCLYELAKKLEDDTFSISLQARVGLDYLSHEIETAKVQLAKVTMTMDDIDPYNINSPEIIHVVSYSEAVKLATPEIINESIQITLEALKDYRKKKNDNVFDFDVFNKEIEERKKTLLDEVLEAYYYLENKFADLYTPQRFYYLFEKGYFPLPYMMDIGKYADVFKYNTTLRDGGIIVIDSKGKRIRTIDRFHEIEKDNELKEAS